MKHEKFSDSAWKNFVKDICSNPAALKEGSRVLTFVKENEDGTFTSGVKMGKLSQQCVFKLDGKPVQITGNTDGKEMTSTNTFKKGLWTARITRSGCPDVLLERTRVGNEIHTKEEIAHFPLPFHYNVLLVFS